MLPFPQALSAVLAHGTAAGEAFAAANPAEAVALHQAPGRVLAQPVRADRDQPPFPRSTRDGFAVRAAELLADGPGLHVAGTLRAGQGWTAPVLPGQAVEIMTGAPVPPELDAVLMVEFARLQPEPAPVPEPGQGGGPADAPRLWSEPGRTLQPGENIVPRGAEAAAGSLLIPAGRRLGPSEIALAAACGYAGVQVAVRPRVAILSTGDELVRVDQTPAAHQIRNSNSAALAALAVGEGAAPQVLPIARDLRSDLDASLSTALATADLLLLSGGVSMGKYDLVEEALREAGAEFFFTGALIQPGKPIVFGRLPRASTASAPAGWTWFFGLPGNPISAQVCFQLFAGPFLRRLAGETAAAPRFAEARLAEPPGANARLTRFLPAELQCDPADPAGRIGVHLLRWQGSGDLATNARANAYAVIPPSPETLPPGAPIRVLLG